MLTYATTNDHTRSNGTSKQASVTTTYNKLVSLFGYPLAGDGYKTRSEWIVLINDGKETHTVTLYDWKRREPITDVIEWNIGGNNKLGASLLVQLIQEAA